MVAVNFNDESGHNNLPWASVLGTGGAAVVFAAVVFGAVVFAAVVFAAVVFGAVVFGAVVFGAVVFGAVVFGAVVFGVVAGVLVVVLGPVVLTAAVSPVPAALETVVGAGCDAAVGVRAVDVTDAAGLLDAASGELEGTGELAASTPVSVGVDELLTSAASPALPLPAATLERPAMTNTTPISTAMAATTRRTRRSQ